MGPAPQPLHHVRVDQHGDTAVVETGTTRFVVDAGGHLQGSWTEAGDVVDGILRITGQSGDVLVLSDGSIAIEDSGPLRVVLLFTATAGMPRERAALDISVRYHFFAGLPSVRVQATVRNPRRAAHAGGYWDLGDPASCLLRDVSFVMSLPGHDAVRTYCSVDRTAGVREYAGRFALYQESSGGEQWQSTNHVNRQGVVPIRFRGYRLQAGAEENGLRATPVVRVQRAATEVAIAQRYFWERFPKAIEVNDGQVRLGLLPAEFPDVCTSCRAASRSARTSPSRSAMTRSATTASTGFAIRPRRRRLPSGTARRRRCRIWYRCATDPHGGLRRAGEGCRRRP